MMMEKLVEWLAGEIEVLGENLPQCCFLHHKPHMLPGQEPGPPLRGGKPATNGLSYGTANSDPLDVQPVASRYTDCAIPAPYIVLCYVPIFFRVVDI
jgi:hypothetical protein